MFTLKWLATLGLLIFGIGTATCQIDSSFVIAKPSSLLYYVDAPDGKNYLVPNIESILRKLTFSTTAERVFPIVNSLNLMLSEQDVRAKVLGTYSYYERETSQLSENQLGTQSDSLLSHTLRSADFFLRINIHS